MEGPGCCEMRLPGHKTHKSFPATFLAFTSAISFSLHYPSQTDIPPQFELPNQNAKMQKTQLLFTREPRNPDLFEGLQ